MTQVLSNTYFTFLCIVVFNTTSEAMNYVVCKPKQAIRDRGRTSNIGKYPR